MALYGSSLGGKTVAGIDNKYGTMPIIRLFGTGAAGTDFPAAAQDGRVVFYSFIGDNPRGSHMVNGDYDAGILSFLKGLPAIPVYFTYSHEPEDNWPNGLAFAQAQAYFIKLVRKYVANPANNIKATVRLAIIFTAYHCDPASPDTLEGWWPSDATLGAGNGVEPDYFGIDVDGWPAGQTSYPDPTTRLNRASAFASLHGVGWGLTEFSHYWLGTTYDADHSGRVAWCRNISAEAISKGASCILYFDGGQSALTSTNEIQAWSTLVANSTDTAGLAAGVTQTPGGGATGGGGGGTTPGGSHPGVTVSMPASGTYRITFVPRHS